MDPARFTRVDPTTWRIEPQGAMRVPAIIYADENLIRDMDDKVFEQAVNVALKPVPSLLTNQRRISILTRTYRIVDEREIGAKACNTHTDTSSVVLAAGSECPAASRSIVLSDRQPERRPIFLDQVAHPAAPLLGELGRVRGGQQAVPWIGREIPGWKQDRAVGALRGSWRHEDHQPLECSTTNTR